MSDKNKKVSGPLLGVCLLLSVASAGLFTSSSYSPAGYALSPPEAELGSIGVFSGLFSAAKAEPEEAPGEQETPAPKEQEAQAEIETEMPKAPAGTKTEARESSVVRSTLPVSEAAYGGIWVSDGAGGWMFMTQDGTVPYSGWLTDVDGKTYYLGDDYLMITGWLEEDGKTYYFDLDGIMQVGEVTVDGEVYTFGSDGILVMAEEEEAKAPEKDTEKEQEKKTAKKSQGALALTFDDGPSDFTEELLACLSENDAHATFFMVGKEAEARPGIPALMASLGMELGNHTYAHTDLTTLTAEEIQTALSGLDEVLLADAGVTSTLIRPPYGNVSEAVKAQVSLPLILWSVDTLDWDTQNVKKIVKEVKAGAKDGAVILMHDSYETTLQAAKEVIPWLKEEGYELLTVHELAERKGITLEAGEVYRFFGEEE